MSLKKYSILIVDDDTDVLTAVRMLLRPEVKEVVTEKRPEQLPSLLGERHFDLVLLDMNFNSAINTGNEGLYWLGRIKAQQPGIAVVMITAYGEIDLAVRSLKEGAADFIVKPWHNNRLLQTISDALQQTGKAKQPAKAHPEQALIYGSEAMEDILHKAEKVAPTDANLLLLGENGTGKDVLAKVIHERSLRASKPFIKVDLGALTESLFESELFGHKKGAFTDAREDRTGRFEAANGGTLFLDEIGNISLNQQARLLSVLQNRQVTQLGTNIAVPVDIRLICATNVPLKELANEARFRKDLIYRINTVALTLPPLRQRPDDIVPLLAHFTALYSNKYFKSGITFSSAAVNRLKQYSFPGNVRELQYVVERAIIMAEDKTIQEADLVFSPIETTTGDAPADITNLSSLEKNTILRVIEKHGGNISKAARELGLTRTALYRRLDKYER